MYIVQISDSYDAGDTANWLPAPATGPFNLTMRRYGAQTPVLEGTYRLPPVTKAR